MSTDFYEVCPRCLRREEHYHRANDLVVAHRYFGGSDVGVRVDFPQDDDQNNPILRVLVADAFESVGLQSLMTTKQLLREIGNGATKHSCPYPDDEGHTGTGWE